MFFFCSQFLNSTKVPLRCQGPNESSNVGMLVNRQEHLSFSAIATHKQKKPHNSAVSVFFVHLLLSKCHGALQVRCYEASITWRLCLQSCSRSLGAVMSVPSFSFSIESGYFLYTFSWYFQLHFKTRIMLEGSSLSMLFRISKILLLFACKDPEN